MKNILKISILILLIFNVVLTKAQFAEKGGINFSNTIFATYSDSNIKLECDNKLYLGFHAGILRRFNINDKIYLQPEVLLHIDKSKFLLTQKISNITENYSQNFIRADIPIYFGYKINPFRFYLGPIINGNLFSLANKENSQFAEYYNFMGSFSTSFSVGIGIDFGKIGIDINYQRNITKFEQNLNKVWNKQNDIILQSYSNVVMFNLTIYN